MTMCFAGKRKPVFFMAERMRSFASLTAASGKPTISNAGKPFEISVSTHTGKIRLYPKVRRNICVKAFISPQVVDFLRLNTISFIAANVSGVPSIAAQMYASVEFKFKAVKMNTIRY